MKCKFAAQAAKALENMRDNGHRTPEREEAMNVQDMIEEEEQGRVRETRSFDDEKDSGKTGEVDSGALVDKETGAGFLKEG